MFGWLLSKVCGLLGLGTKASASGGMSSPAGAGGALPFTVHKAEEFGNAASGADPRARDISFSRPWGSNVAALMGQRQKGTR